MLVPVCHIYDEALDSTGCIFSRNILYSLQSVLDRFISCLALLWTGMSEGKSMLTTLLPYITFVPMFYECEWPYNESPACECAFVHTIIKTKSGMCLASGLTCTLNKPDALFWQKYRFSFVWKSEIVRLTRCQMDSLQLSIDRLVTQVIFYSTSLILCYGLH